MSNDFKQSTRELNKLTGEQIADLLASLSPEEKAKYDEWATWFESEGKWWFATEDFNTFAELVARDDETQEPIKQAPIHRRWAELCELHDRLLIWSHINSGKTTQLSVLRTIWELGRDANLRVVILSNTSSIATKIVKSVANYIKNSEEVHRIFPALVPNPDGPWTGTELQVVRSSKAKDPSVRAVGVHGSLTSARVDRLIVDDILDPENTETEAARKKVEGWYKAVAVGRLTPKARVLIVGTAYHPKDLLHSLARTKGFKAYRFPVINKAGQVAWPDLWPQSRIDQKRDEMGPAEFARQLLCLARDDEEARFKQDWIDAALDRGEGLRMVQNIAEIFEDGEIPDGWGTFTGVDLAVTKKKRSDETAFFTFLEDPKGNRRLLSIEAGKLTGPDIVGKIIDHHIRYKSTIAVESNAAQAFILQFTTDISNVPVLPHTTTKAKRDPILGVEGLAVELFNNKWTIPSNGRKTSAQAENWITEMLFYNPKTHTGDRLMACYFARELARKMLGSKSGTGVRVRVVGDGPGGKPARVETIESFAERLFTLPEPKTGAAGVAVESN